MSKINLVSNNQKYFKNGQLDRVASKEHFIEVVFLSDKHIRVDVEDIISDLVVEFDDESLGKRAYVSEDKKWVFQLLTGTGEYENAEDITACVVMEATTANYVMLNCDPDKETSKKKKGIKGELIRELLSEDNFLKAQKQIEDGGEIVSVENEELPLRLFKSTENSVNLEILLDTNIGKFFKPIGIYLSNNKIIVPEEFDRTVEELLVSSTITITRLSLEANAVIGAFSVNTLLKIDKNEGRYISNGIEMMISTNYTGNKEVSLSEKYDIEDPICVYSLDDNKLAPTSYFEDTFKDMEKYSLLSAYKSL